MVVDGGWRLQWGRSIGFVGHGVVEHKGESSDLCLGGLLGASSTPH